MRRKTILKDLDGVCGCIIALLSLNTEIQKKNRSSYLSGYK